MEYEGETGQTDRRLSLSHSQERGADYDSEKAEVDVENDIENEPSSEDDTLEIEVPDGGYGWFAVAALFLFNFATWGANASFAIYLAHYLNNNVFAGVTKLEYGVVGGLTFGSGTMFASVINYMAGAVGIRAVITFGAVLQFAALLLASFAKKYWQLVLTQGLMLGVGMAAVAVPSLVLVPQWFRKKRSLALGIGAAGSGLGGVTFSLGLQHLIQVKSYQWALRTEAIMCVVAVGVGLFLAKTRREIVKPELKILDRLSVNFGIFMALLWVFWTILGYVVLLYNLADFTVSLGYSSHQSSIVSTMISVGGFFFRPLVGQISDRFGPITVNVVVHLLVAVFVFAMWIPARNLPTAALFALIEGGLMGSIWVVSASITTRIVGLKKLGICMGTVWVAIGASGIVSPIIGIALKQGPPAGKTSDPTQYLHPSVFVGCSFLAASLSLFILRGWVIARDELLQELKQDGVLKEDTGEELMITVPPAYAFKRCFKLVPIKKT